jgi:transcriptional regulator GlxA family with amidase domain
MKIVVAGIDGCLPSGLIGLVDLLLLARQAIMEKYGGDPWQIVTASSNGHSLTDSHGHKLEVDARLQDIPVCYVVLVPGFVPDDRRRPPRMLGLSRAARWLRTQYQLGALVYGSCSGVFLLGEAGLLNQRRCTTAWWLHDEMRRRYPSADVAWGATIVEDRRVISSGGPLSWIDLALHVIRTLSGLEPARTVADLAVIGIAPAADAVYVPASYVAAADPFILAAEQVIR